jgi:peptidyl-tRNA hydrolase
MTRCAYFHTPDPFDSEDKFFKCEAEAEFTCCDFGGPVCSEHKCRCSQPVSTEKLHVVTRADLPPGAQGVQSMHAAIQFHHEHPDVGQRWFRESNHLAWLQVSDEIELEKLIDKAERLGVKYSVFREPDLGDRLTAIAFEPGRMGRKVCSGLELANPNS